MNPPEAELHDNAPFTVNRRRLPHVILVSAVVAFTSYYLIAYLLLPLVWRRYEKRHPALNDVPRVARTSDGIPGDPLNIALVGTEKEIHLAMLAAKWDPADPVTLESSLRIAVDTVVRRPYDDAPVSPLFVWGRKQDLAFEQPIGDDPRRRHHVRYWRSEKVDDNGDPLWIGAATLDVRVGLSHTTGEITHHIGPQVDSERDKILADLQAVGDLETTYWIDEFQEKLSGKNGGGDPYETDGRLAVGVIDVKSKTNGAK